MTTPVAIVFFNRLAPLKRLVARLAEVRPPKVYLISDGPRATRPDDAAKVAACRAFLSNLPWPCEVKTNFSEANLGCRVRVTTGLDWVFENEEEAILLEDDCIPEPAFFPWAERMLARYRDDPRVLSVGGTNLRPQLCRQDVDCTFAKYAMIWGWATWRRAWRLNDRDLAGFPQACRAHLFKQWLGSWRAEGYWRYILTHVRSSWGYRWSFTHFAHRGLCVLPPVNLVENIGLSGVEATHTSNTAYDLPAVTRDWTIPAAAPDAVAPNARLDKWIEDNFYSRSFIGRLKWLARKIKGRIQHG